MVDHLNVSYLYKKRGQYYFSNIKYNYFYLFTKYRNAVYANSVAQYIILNKEYQMPVYKLWVRVPVGSGSQTRPIQVEITANHPTDAIAIAQGQYGSENVTKTATKVRD